MDSRISSSVSVQLQKTILPYSRPGRMEEVYIVAKVFLSIKFFNFAKIFNFLPEKSPTQANLITYKQGLAGVCKISSNNSTGKERKLA